MMQPPIPPRSRDRLAALRLPELPPRDLERLERLSTGPHSAPALTSAPDSASCLIPPSLTTPTKFGGEGSPADVRAYSSGVTPLLMRGGVVSPGVGGGSGLVLPTLSLPLSGSPAPPPPPPPVPHHLPHVSLTLPCPPPLTSPPAPSRPALPTSPSIPCGPSFAQSNSLRGSLSSAPIHVSQNLASINVSRSPGINTTPSSPVPCLTQNEIKKAQNRKSAKRFREAQKQRWKNMADDLMAHKRTIDELRAQLAAQASSLAPSTNHYRSTSFRAPADAKRSSMSINDLVDDTLNGGMNSYAEAEASLYAQILSNRASNNNPTSAYGTNPDSGFSEPYVKELGLLTRCVVVEKSCSRIVSVRRGAPNGVGTLAIDGLSEEEANKFRSALVCGKPVAMRYCRNGSNCSCVMDPIEGSDRVIVAEFVPF